MPRTRRPGEPRWLKALRRAHMRHEPLCDALRATTVPMLGATTAHGTACALEDMTIRGQQAASCRLVPLSISLPDQRGGKSALPSPSAETVGLREQTRSIRIIPCRALLGAQWEMLGQGAWDPDRGLRRLVPTCPTSSTCPHDFKGLRAKWRALEVTKPTGRPPFRLTTGLR